MNEARLTTIEQIEQFLNASTAIEFSAAGDDGERYAHISRVLKRFDYPDRNKRERGVLLKYLQHTSGYSRAQVTRLVTRWQRNRLAEVPLAKRYRAPAVPFARKYTPVDIELLVEMDQAHEDVCGPAIAHLLQRAYRDYDDPRYERLATLSVSHLYNLRKSAGYQAQRMAFTKTRPVCNAIGVRKAPGPEGRAGFVRIDTVHQRDQDGVKGVYHLTCVDAVSQWQVEACVQGISEAFLLPVLALIIDQFHQGQRQDRQALQAAGRGNTARTFDRVGGAQPDCLPVGRYLGGPACRLRPSHQPTWPPRRRPCSASSANSLPRSST